MEAESFDKRIEEKMGVATLPCVVEFNSGVVAEFGAGGADGGDFVATICGGICDVEFEEAV